MARQPSKGFRGKGEDLAIAEASKPSEAANGIGSDNGPDGQAVNHREVTWAECRAYLIAAQERFLPELICRAWVPCSTAPESFMGQYCGFPLERSNEYKFLLNTGRNAA